MPTSPLTLTPPTENPAPKRRRRRLVSPAVAVVALALVVTGGAYVAHAGPASPEDAASAPYDEDALPDAPDVTTPPLPAAGPVGIPLADDAAQATIDRITAASTTTASPGELGVLARLLLQRAAVTGDAETYGRATAALDRAVAMAPDDLAIRAQRASTRSTVHDWAGAMRDANFVLAVNPQDPGALAASYDAAFETGQYALAQTRLDLLVKLGPAAPQVLIREARWSALHGDVTGAANLAARARTAADASGAVGTARGSYDLVAGKLDLDEGRYDLAIGAYQSALTAAPGWHAALAGLGRALAASGDLVGAEKALSQAADTVPLPDTLSSLGDVRTALGDTAGADLAYGTVEVVARLEEVQRLFNRAVALSRADRGVHTVSAVRDARSEFATRKDVYGEDALGWALLANGQTAEAVKHADQSLRLGTQDPRLLAHAGLAHAAAGDTAQARTLLNAAIALSPTVEPLLMDRVRAALAALPAGATP